MIDVSLALQHFGISNTSALRGVQEVHELIESAPNPCKKATELVEKILGVTVDFPQTDDRAYIPAYITVQAIVQNVIRAGCKFDDANLVVEEGRQHCAKFMSNPANAWMFAVEQSITAPTNDVAVAEGIDIKVAVKADGTIKKGGKQILAKALYEQYRASPEFDANNENQPFIAILVKQLGMSKAGATTYNYDLKKAFGGTIVAKSKK